METPELITPEYWHGSDVDIRLNPAQSFDVSLIESEIEKQGITSSVVLATSGSSGRTKFVVLSKQALLTSAEQVNQWCDITGDDIWLGGLSTFHVGGLGIYCRAFLTGSKVNPMQWNRWTRDGSAFLEAVRDATITSLTPVHLYDLVQAKVRCPASLRGVFIGGGALSRDLADRAIDLGWPLWTTYGMTEACSQIATSLSGDTDILPVLPHWETAIAESGELKIKGPSLMTGFFTADGDWTGQDSFYTTGDLVELHNNSIRPLGRRDDQVKILGELVSPAKLEKRLNANAIIVAIPDSRRGAKLAAIFEGEIPDFFKEWNDKLPPFEKITEVHKVDQFPRTESGKVDRQSLAGKFSPAD